MSIVLSWNKKDSDDVLNSYEIYRSTVKATLYQEANRIAEIADKAQVEYTDANTQYDTPYWYGVRSKTVYGDVDSTPLLLVEVTNPGYGPVEPVVGDYEDGFVAIYPGEISFTSAASKILNNEMAKYYPATDINSTASPAAGGISPNGGYALNKFWRNGRMIFAPNHPIGGIASSNLSITNFYNNVIAPLIAAKPQVEIEGVLYEFRIMTRDEVLKYNASGCTSLHTQATNRFSDRVAPHSYHNLTPTSYYVRLFHQNTGTGVVGVDISNPTTVPDLTLGSTLGATVVGIAWYFTPVIN
jgi:hypothetical protein